MSTYKQCSMSTLKKNRVTGEFNRCLLTVQQGCLTCKLHKDFEEVIGDADQTFFEEFPEQCPICCEELNMKHDPLPCGHWIHKSCVVKSGKSECPICRARVYLTDAEWTELYKNSIVNQPEQIQDIPPDHEDIEAIILHYLRQNSIIGENDTINVLNYYTIQ